MPDALYQTTTLRQQLTSIVATVPFGIIVISEEYEVSIINERAVHLLGFESLEPKDLIDICYLEALSNIPILLDKFEHFIINGKRREFDLKNIRSSEYHINIKCRPMLQGTLIIIEDISKIVELRHQATHDNLTQLANRQYFEERLQTVMRKSIKRNVPGAVVYIDIDQFKPVNDTAGHLAGDALLKQVATVIHSRIRERGPHS